MLVSSTGSLPSPAMKCDNGQAGYAGDATRMPRVLVIDDDRELTGMLVDYLSPEGFVVEMAHTGEDGLAQALATEYALIILDVMLPQLNGLEVLRRLRTHSACPVIMLTARGQEVDRIVGLEIGADDYLGKPFSARELLARMHAVLRRTHTAAPESHDDVLAVGDVVMDVPARTVRRAGQLVELTSLEFDVLKALLAATGEVVSREELFTKVLKREYSVFDRSIDNHVSSVRKKLGPQVGETERIRSVRNAGYIYARTPRNAGRT
jgi:two-component system, OmpR family, response regulator CpxR